jgi:hypothetical protein
MNERIERVGPERFAELQRAYLRHRRITPPPIGPDGVPEPIPTDAELMASCRSIVMYDKDGKVTFVPEDS